MYRDLELLNRYLDDGLTPDEVSVVEARLRDDVQLRARLDRLRAVRQAVSLVRVDSFAPYFSDRVMKRLAPAKVASAADGLYEGLRFAFARTAVAGLAVAGVLAAYNMLTYGEMGVASTLPEVLFGLPSASLIDVLSYSGY